MGDDTEWRNRVRKLSELRAQDAFVIFRRCFLPQRSHLLRTLDFPALEWGEADRIDLTSETRWFGSPKL